MSTYAAAGVFLFCGAANAVGIKRDDTMQSLVPYELRSSEMRSMAYGDPWVPGQVGWAWENGSIPIPFKRHPRLDNRTICDSHLKDGFLYEFECANWAGNFKWKPSEILSPHTEDELSNILKMATKTGKKIKMFGLGHSWSNVHIPNDNGVGMTLANLDVFEVDDKSPQMTVTVSAGMTFKEMNTRLDGLGYAVSWKSGGIQTLTIGGAISVGYHGSQIGVGTISSVATELKVAFANGTFAILKDSDGDTKVLNAIRTGIGLSAIIVWAKIPIEKQYYLKRRRWVVDTMDEFVKDHLPVWNKFPAFHWYWHPYTDKVWLMTWEDTTKEEAMLENRPCRDALLQWEDSLATEFGEDGTPLVLRWDNCSDMSHKAYTHADDMKAQPIYNKEYFLPNELEFEVIEKFVAAVRAPDAVKPDINFWVHERYLVADDSYLMPCYGFKVCSSFEVAQASVTMDGDLPPWELWRNQTMAYDSVMQSFGGRPHWGKENRLDYEYLTASGLGIDEFMKIRDELDPTEMFMTDYIERYLKPADKRKKTTKYFG